MLPTGEQAWGGRATWTPPTAMWVRVHVHACARPPVCTRPFHPGSRQEAPRAAPGWRGGGSSAEREPRPARDSPGALRSPGSAFRDRRCVHSALAGHSRHSATRRAGSDLARAQHKPGLLSEPGGRCSEEELVLPRGAGGAAPPGPASALGASCNVGSEGLPAKQRGGRAMPFLPRSLLLPS